MLIPNLIILFSVKFILPGLRVALSFHRVTRRIILPNPNNPPLPDSFPIAIGRDELNPHYPDVKNS
jgi:hypothetical protein